MERVLAEKSIVRFTAPLKIRDKEGNYVPDDQRIPSEISSKIQRGDVSYETSKRLQDILNCILPPREWEEDGELWMQQVSPEPATRNELNQLRVLVDQRLKAMKALDSGIDPTRRYVYSQLMDELIRQEVIVNTERGILLLKIRDELKMTLEANRSLFENGKIYGSHKAFKAESLQESLESSLNSLQKERDSLYNQVNCLKALYKDANKTSIQSFLRYDKVCIDELNKLNEIANGLKHQLNSILAAMV